MHDARSVGFSLIGTVLRAAARLILLHRRLHDRCDFVSLIPGGRGRFRLDMRRPWSSTSIHRF